MILPDVLSGKGQGGSDPDSHSDIVSYFFFPKKTHLRFCLWFSVRTVLFPLPAQFFSQID